MNTLLMAMAISEPVGWLALLYSGDVCAHAEKFRFATDSEALCCTRLPAESVGQRKKKKPFTPVCALHKKRRIETPFQPPSNQAHP